MSKRSRLGRSRGFDFEALEGRTLLSASAFLHATEHQPAHLAHQAALSAARTIGAQSATRANRAHGNASALASPTYKIAHLNGATPDGTTGPTGITPAKMRHAYGADAVSFGGVTGNGAGQTIAIIDAYDDPTIASDLHNFDVAFGLPDAPSFTKLNQNGGTALPGIDTSTKPNTWELEEALDVEWAHVMAPAASIILYEANSASFNDLVASALNSARNNPSVSAISMSFGGGEFSGQTSYDSYFTTPSGHKGITFVASTGDSGSPGGYPAFSPNVVAVGGTTLSVDSSGNYLSEKAWSGSGGGTSTQESEPSYQSGFQSTGKRTIPDVAMDADPNSGVPVYDTFDNGTSTPWIQIGGTSLASPMFAGLIAVADQGRVHNGLSTMDGRNQTLPALYQAAASNYHDVTSGSNGGFSATTGYDEVTGRGSPIAGTLLAALAGTPTSTLAAPSNLAAKAVSTTQVNLTWTDNATTATSNVVQRSSNGGSTWATLATLGGTAASYSDTTAAAGATYSYRVYASNGSTNSAYSNTATVTTIPAAPQGLTATAASSSQINLSWGGVTGATGYRIDRSPDGSTWSTIANVGAVTSYQNTGLAASTTYYYRVLATNGSGTSAASATASAKTLAASTTTIPAAPSNFSAYSVSNTAARLSWTDNSNNESGFRIEYSLDGTNWYTVGNVAANTTSVQVTGMTTGTVYYFRVRSYNSAGTSAPSNWDWVQPPYV